MTRRAGFAVWCCFAIVIPGFAQDLPEKEQWFARFDSAQVAELEQDVQRIYAAVAPSVVRIQHGENKQSEVSGVIVDRRGLVLTCAHHDEPPGSAVSAQMHDGRIVEGKTLGLIAQPTDAKQMRAHDLGLIQLDGEGPWPAVPLGKCYDLRNGEICLSLGSPKGHERGQPPLLRLGRILPSTDYGMVNCSCRVLKGDSGGPLFNRQGELLGVCVGSPGVDRASAEYTSNELFTALSDRLRQGEEIIAARPKLGRSFHAPVYAFGAFSPTEDEAQRLLSVRQCTVEVLADGAPVALGVVVGSDGVVLTKRTEIVPAKQLACRLHDGRTLDARIVGQTQSHDLALLRVAATDLPTANWSDETDVSVGQLIASVGMQPEDPVDIGVVSGTKVANPGTHGELPIGGKAAPEGVSGVVFMEFWKNRIDFGDLNKQLEPGDLITHLDGKEIRTPANYDEVHTARMAAEDALIGERVDLTVRRGDSVRHVFAPITPGGTLSRLFWEQEPFSLRRNGFPVVFSHDASTHARQCGGPVVDRSGRIVGINIARANHVQVFAIPADVVRKVIDELRASKN